MHTHTYHSSIYINIYNIHQPYPICDGIVCRLLSAHPQAPRIFAILPDTSLTLFSSLLFFPSITTTTRPLVFLPIAPALLECTVCSTLAWNWRKIEVAVFGVLMFTLVLFHLTFSLSRLI